MADRNGKAKPLASLSLDLDNQWSYMKTHGDSDWESFPSYLDLFVPHLQTILDRVQLKITFFIVGQDAHFEKNREALALISQSGHEVANHSLSHEPYFHLYSPEETRRQILKAEELISGVTGQKPIGFRGPGFSWTPQLLEVLAENEYIYDATTFPTYLGPVARAFYFATSNLSDAEKRKLGRLYGSFRDGLRPLKPYKWRLPSGAELLEIPVSTMPVARFPFHMTYLIYLCGYSEKLMFAYLKAVVRFCKMTKIQPSFLLHPLDILGRDQVPELAYFPGMNMDSTYKAEIFETVIGLLAHHFQLVPMKEHAQWFLNDNGVASHSVIRK